MTILTPEQGRELKSQYQQLPVVAHEAFAILASKGMSSQEFRAADKRLGDIFSRIREIQGE
jgi:hypothetical protein